MLYSSFKRIVFKLNTNGGIYNRYNVYPLRDMITVSFPLMEILLNAITSDVCSALTFFICSQ